MLSLETGPDVQCHVLAGYDIVETTDMDMEKVQKGNTESACLLREQGQPGTIGIHLGNGSLCFEVASREVHGSTQPAHGGTRAAAVFFTHRKLQ